MRKFLAGLAAALFAFTPVLASAQTISSVGANTFPLAGSCGTVAVSTPCLNLTQGWSGTATFTLDFANVSADPGPSNAASLLIDRQYLGVSKFRVDRTGAATFASTVNSQGSLILSGNIFLNAGQNISWATSSLVGEAANTLALRNGVNGQTSRVYNTYTDASNGEWGTFDWSTSANTLTIGPKANGTGTVRGVTALGAWSFSGSIFSSGALQTASSLTVGSAAAIAFTSRAAFASPSDGVLQIGNSAGTQTATITIGASNLLTFQGGGTFGGTITTGSGGLTITGNGGATIGTGGVATTGAISSTTTIRVGTYVVSGLPSASAVGAGAHAWVSDATQTFVSANFGVTVTGGGANGIPVVSDGTNWKIGG